jgi:hypothetical protein
VSNKIVSQRFALGSAVATRAVATKATERLRYRSTAGAEDGRARTPIVDMVAVGVVFAAGNASDAGPQTSGGGRRAIGDAVAEKKATDGNDGGWRSREAVRLSRCGFGERRRGWDVVLTENAISQIVAVSRQERAPATGPARSTKTSTSTHSEKTFTPAPSQWAGESGSTGPIEIQGPQRQDMRPALGSVRTLDSRRRVGSSSG